MDYKELANQKDDGSFAMYGMKHYLSECSNVYPFLNAECINYIVETFLECIDSVDFHTWLKKGNSDGRPIIITREMLKKDFKDLLIVSEDLETISDLFMYLYNVDMWVDKKTDCLYTTMFDIDYDNRKKLDFIGIVHHYERISTIMEYNQAKWSDIYDAIASIELCGYDIVSDYDCIYINSDDGKENINKTIDMMRERLQQVFLLSE